MGLANAIWLKVRPTIARYRRNSLVRAVSEFSRVWLKAYENCNGDFATNGEERILRRLQGANPKIILDVGANYGEWTLLALHYHPRAAIFALELSPPTFKALVRNTAGAAAITPVNVGLSNAAGTIEFYHYADKPGETSLMEHAFQQGAEKLTGQVLTGDQFCQKHMIEHIDLLKIDVEGMESAVLKGFERMLGARRIDVIQFEYEKLNPRAHFFLEDFYRLLGGKGFVIGKIYPTYTDFRPYQFGHELEWGSNYLAVLESRKELRELLAR